jgi:hypothetical protein
MASIAQISENEQREIEGTLKKFFIDYRIGSLLMAYWSLLFSWYSTIDDICQ